MRDEREAAPRVEAAPPHSVGDLGFFHHRKWIRAEVNREIGGPPFGGITGNRARGSGAGIVFRALVDLLKHERAITLRPPDGRTNAPDGISALAADSAGRPLGGAEFDGAFARRPPRLRQRPCGICKTHDDIPQSVFLIRNVLVAPASKHSEARLSVAILHSANLQV
jgi:hypothetical protein